MAATATAGEVGQDTDAAVSTRSPWLPCLLAWAIPGAGHLLLRRTTAGLVFMVVVLGTFGFGLALNGTVYAMDPEQPLSYLSTLANAGVGPLDAWARVRTFGDMRYRMPDSRVDSVARERVLTRVRARYAAATHSYGRTFLLTAGLMNLLLVLDVFDYCIGRKPHRSPRSQPAEGSS
jgi:hypothetical protein